MKIFFHGWNTLEKSIVNYVKENPLNLHISGVYYNGSLVKTTLEEIIVNTF